MLVRYILPLLFMVSLTGATYYIKGRRANTPTTTLQPFPAAIVPSASYRYDAPPSISREAYGAIVCAAGPACDDAGAMYDVLVAARIDPVIEAAQAQHETGLGTAGVGQSAYKNLHGVQCHASDGRIADSSVPWGNGCAGVYASYTDSVRTWANVINQEYVGMGLNTPALAVSKYAPVSDGNDLPAYVADMERHIDQWRAEYGREETQPVFPQRADIIPDWQQRVNPDARFSTINCGAWGFQSGCQHFGTDILGNGEGTPVYAPYGGTYTGCQDNGDGGPYIGKWIEYTADDGARFLINHFRDSPFCGAAVGTRIDAGDFIGTMRGDANHVHVQISVSGQLVDFEEFWETH